MKASRLTANLNAQEFTVHTVANGTDAETITYHPERDGVMEIRFYDGQVITVELDSRYAPQYGDEFELRFRPATTGDVDSIVIFNWSGGQTLPCSKASGSHRYETFALATSWTFYPRSGRNYVHNVLTRLNDWELVATMATPDGGAARSSGPVRSTKTSNTALHPGRIYVPALDSTGANAYVRTGNLGFNGFNEFGPFAVYATQGFTRWVTSPDGQCLLLGVHGSTNVIDRLVYSSDWGGTWSNSINLSTRRLIPIRASDTTHWAVFGEQSGASSFIYYSTNAGGSWTSIYTDLNFIVDAVGIDALQKCWAVQSGGQVYEFDGIQAGGTPTRIFRANMGGTGRCIDGNSTAGILAAGDDGRWCHWDIGRGVASSGQVISGVSWRSCKVAGHKFWLLGKRTTDTWADPSIMAYTETRGRSWTTVEVSLGGDVEQTALDCDGEKWLYLQPSVPTGMSADDGVSYIYRHHFSEPLY